MVCIQKVGLLLRGAPSMTPYSTSPNRHMGSSRVEWQIVREVVTKFSISSKCGARVLGEVSAGMPPPKTWGFLWSNFPNFFPQKISHREGPNENPSFKETVPHGLKPMFAWMIYMRWGFYSDETKSDVWSRYLSSHVHPFVSMRIIVIYPSQATSTAQSSSAAVTKRFVLLSFVWWWCLQS